MTRAAGRLGAAAALLTAFSLGLDPLATALRRVTTGWPRPALAADAAAFCLVILLVGLVRAAGGGARASVAGRSARPAAAAALAALALLGLVALGVRLLDPGFDAREFARRGLGDPRALAGLLILIPFAVLAEEIVFRTCQDGIRPALGTTSAAAAMAGAFALHHLDLGRFPGRHEATILAAAAAGGLVLARLYEAAPSVALVAAVHLAYDFLALAQARFNVDGRGPEEATLFGLWIAGAAASAAWLLRKEGRPPWRAFRSAGSRPRGDGPALGRRARLTAAVLFGIALPLLLSLLRSVL